MEMQSLEIGKLAESLCKAQKQIKGAKEDCKNPYFKSDYADLTSVWKACRNALTDNGIAVCQTIDTEQEKIVLITTLLHSSGQWIRSKLPVILTKNDPQTLGSSLTYSRRYALAAIAGVCPMGEDDDAEEAMKEEREKKDVSQSLSKDQIQALDEMLDQDPEAEEKIKKALKIGSVYEMPLSKFNGIMKTLQTRQQEKENGQARMA